MKALRLFLSLAIFGACLLFCSCTPVQTNLEELLDAPRLSETQTDILQVLTDEVGQQVKLKYPRTGDYRSAFSFFDLDSDGEEEAIVLYSVDSVSYIVMLDQQNGHWASAGSTGQHLPGLGTDIDFVSFARLSTADEYSLLVGWIPPSGEKSLAVYRFVDDSFRLIYDEVYSEIAIHDFEGDGIYEIVLLSISDYGNLLFLAGENRSGIFTTLDVAELDQELTFFTSPVCGLLGEEDPGLLLDAQINSSTLCTVILRVRDREFLEPRYNLSDTRRSGSVYAGDINADGYLEIPTAVVPPGQQNLALESRVFFTDYCRLDGHTLIPICRAYVNTDLGYRLLFPERWTDDVTAWRFQENNEILFYLYHLDDPDNQSSELLRLRCSNSQGYPDRLETKSYFTIAQRGSFYYYAYLPPADDIGLVPAAEELSVLFSLIN